MLPNVAIISRPSQNSVSSLPYSRVPALAAEARRLARRRSIAEGVARRGSENARGLAAAASAELAQRSKARAARLGLVFHRAIGSLWEAGGFDEALAIFREHKTDRDRRASGGSALDRRFIDA